MTFKSWCCLRLVYVDFGRLGLVFVQLCVFGDRLGLCSLSRLLLLLLELPAFLQLSLFVELFPVIKLNAALVQVLLDGSEFSRPGLHVLLSDLGKVCQQLLSLKLSPDLGISLVVGPSGSI